MLLVGVCMCTLMHVHYPLVHDEAADELFFLDNFQDVIFKQCFQHFKRLFSSNIFT